MQLVATALGNRVHQSAGKVAITDVVRSKYDLVLLHRVDGDHLAVSDTSHRTVTEQEALSHAVDQVTIEPEAHAGSGDPAESGTDLRHQSGKVEDITIECRYSL